MDPSSISPIPTPTTTTTTVVPFTTEPNNNHPPPLPPPSAPPIPTHPPYAEMIYRAIEALKEKDGSSKRAIGKYIEQVYNHQNLPSTHSTLLTHHLKRLKSSGLLQMVKKSYMIPRSAPQNTTVITVNSSAAAASAAAAQVSPPASRPRGRPRKIPTTQAQAQAQPDINNNNNNVWASLGLADEPVAVQAVPLEVSKRRPGRPRRSVPPAATAAVSQVGSSPSVTTPARRGRPPGSKSVSKRRPGRPPKNVPVSAPVAATTAAAGVVSGLPKRRPGRPAKNQHSQPTPIPFAAPTASVSETAPVEIAGGDVASGEVTRSRGRGRPRKNAVPVTAGRGRGRGRGSGGGRGSGAGRGRGRGRGGSVQQQQQEHPRPGKRSVGRPRKGTTSASAPPNAANEDLKRKLEHFQAKVKESLAVLKPHFNHESPVTTIAAIQELEVLGTMDLNAPLKDDTVSPPQQQPQPQQQPLQQQLVQQYPLPPQQQVFYQQQFSELHRQQYHQQLQQYPQQPASQQQQQFHP